MANIFSVEPPAWLQEIAKPVDAKATGQMLGLLLAGAKNAAANDVSFAEGFSQARQNLADPQWALKVKQAEAQTEMNLARTKQAWEMIDLQQQEQRAWMADLPAIREFAAKPIEQQITEPLGAMQSKRGNQTAIQMNRAASSSAVSKSMQDAKSDYDKRVAEIVKADPEVGVGLALPPNQFPRPINFRSLEIAEQRVRVRRESTAAEAEISALSRGDEVTTTIDEKGGVTKTFKPTTEDVKPEEATLSDGTKIVYNPKTGSFKILNNKGEEKDLTATQLQSIADSVRGDDGKIIKAFLAKKAVKQVQGAKQEGAVAPAPGGEISFDDYLKNWKQSR